MSFLWGTAGVATGIPPRCRCGTIGVFGPLVVLAAPKLPVVPPIVVFLTSGAVALLFTALFPSANAQ